MFFWGWRLFHAGLIGSAVCIKSFPLSLLLLTLLFLIVPTSCLTLVIIYWLTCPPYIYLTFISFSMFDLALWGHFLSWLGNCGGNGTTMIPCDLSLSFCLIPHPCLFSIPLSAPLPHPSLFSLGLSLPSSSHTITLICWQWAVLWESAVVLGPHLEASDLPLLH